MNYLALDTSGSHLTVLLGGDGGSRTYFNENCSLKHSVVLMEAIENVLSSAGLNADDIDVFCCCLGPGSFTGIRIGVATVKGLAYALKKKVLGITSFDVLAYNNTAESSVAAVDAKHGHVYAAEYAGGELISLRGYVSVEEVKGYGKRVLAAAPVDGLDVTAASLADGLRAAAEAKLHLATSDIETLIPLYIRKSQAEEGR